MKKIQKVAVETAGLLLKQGYNCIIYIEKINNPTEGGLVISETVSTAGLDAAHDPICDMLNERRSSNIQEILDNERKAAEN